MVGPAHDSDTDETPVALTRRIPIGSGGVQAVGVVTCSVLDGPETRPLAERARTW